MNTNNVPPPPGMMSPIRNSVGVSQSPGGRPSSEQQQIHSYLSSPLNTNSSALFVSSPGNGSVSSSGMLRRRAATEDNTQLFLHSHNNSTQQQQPQLTQHQRSTSTNGLPWTNIQSNSNIFRSDKGLGSPGNSARRVSQEEQRNESTHRLRSDLLDPMLLSPTNNNSIDDEDNDEHRLGSPRQQHTPKPVSNSGDIFRNNNRGYSPIIGTPTRASGGRKPMYNITSTSHGGAQVGGLRNNLSLSSNSDTDSVTSGGGHWSSNNSQASASGFATTIRPSLSCPTSVFESPLFPSNTNSNIAGGNVHPLTRLGSRGSSLGRSANHLQLGGGTTTNTLLLSQPYRLEKITSGSVEPSPINNSGDHHHQYEFEDEDDLLDNVKSQDVFDTESSPIKSPSENSSTNNPGGHRLNLDVSVIEVEDDDSPHRRPIADNNKGTQDRQLKQSPNTGGSQHSMASQINNMTASQHANNTAGSKNNTSRPSTAGNESNTTQTTMLDVDGNPMRNLSDAFELLVVDGQQQPLHSQHVYAQQQQQRGGANNIHANQMNDTSMLTNNNDVTKNNSGETSATKPSPTSVSDFGGETTSSSSLTTNSTNNNIVSTTKKKTHQLANGLTVASISMPHFHLHDTLRGTLNQGLIDRASFYSVLRDINKEALDATLTDPKGHLYNDGSVHEKNKVNGGNKGGKKNKKQQGQVGGQSSDANNDTTNTNDGKKKKERPTPIVIADDGKVHVHPNPKEEQKSILVMACVTDENNETVSEQQLASLREKPVSLGAALLDEEWWLMSAIASRTPNEVAMNQSTNLLPTFFEAMGEKDANSVADSTGVYSTGATSRTQLWKPGRSWWEAKSGKNPWVEPVVHNNRWR